MNDEEEDLYAQATQRNIGLLTLQEQGLLQKATVAIAGLGATGGNYLVTLARLGVGGFVIADGDTFEVPNLHRQAGAFMTTLGQPKAEVMSRIARDINPDVRVTTINSNVDETNVDELLKDADLVLDGIDFFQIDARRLLFRAARGRGIYGITSAPIGTAAALHVFAPDGMDFDTYFGITEEMTRPERLASYAVGLAPALSRGRPVQRRFVDFKNERGPALCSSVMVSAGIVGNEVMRLLLHRGPPLAAPYATYFDPMSGRYDVTQRPTGRGLRAWFLRRLAFFLYPGLRQLHDAQAVGAGDRGPDDSKPAES